MPRPIPVPLRQAMFRLWQQGQRTGQIAASLGLPCSTIRRLLGRFRRDGRDGIVPDYHRPSAVEATPSDVARAALRVRREHPTWGAGLIRVHLLQGMPGQAVPSVRTLQRWFERADLSPAPAGRRPQVERDRSTRPHETWQMDAKEHIRIRTGDEVSWLRLIDECSGAVRCSGPRFPPLGTWSRVPPSDVRARLRQAFGRWGLPVRFRVDNGTPWGSWGDFPTDLSLWLIGLGVDVHWNNPRSPQENGVVERSQGTSDRWCEPWTCATPEELQARLERMDRLYREIYPYRERLSRMEFYPGLAHTGRPYDVDREAALWDWSRVAERLSTSVVVRRVDQSGKVSLYNRGHYVGYLHKGKDVYVMYDPGFNEWLFTDLQGHQLRRRPAEELSRQRVMDLEVTNRRQGTFE